MEEVKLYDLSEGGVNLVKSNPHMANNEFRQAQNAAFGKVETGGGIETRAGMAKFNTEAMDGAVVGFVNVPLADEREGGGGGGGGEIMYPVEVIEDLTVDPDCETSLEGAAATLWEALRDEDATTFWRVASTPGEGGGGGQGWCTVRLESPAVTPVATAGHQLIVRVRASLLNYDFADTEAGQVLDVQFRTAAGFATTWLAVVGMGTLYTTGGYATPLQEFSLVTDEDTWVTCTANLDEELVTELLAAGWFADARVRLFLGWISLGEFPGEDDVEWTTDLAQIHYVIP